MDRAQASRVAAGDGRGAPSRGAFDQLAGPLRRELKLHCYRMLGSLQEAEDQVQETFLRAWRAFDRFEGPSLRAWLYRIATNACLSALGRRAAERRVLPDQLGPASAPRPPGDPAREVPWLEPYPDAELGGLLEAPPTPETRVAAREAVRLAFVAGLHRLPARQRAALLLCDVLGFSAAEAAGQLGSSVASVNSALQRARETMGRGEPPARPGPAPEAGDGQAALLARYVEAWERHDVDGLVALLAEEAIAAMPPWPEWFAGRDAIGAFFRATWQTCPGVRLLPTGANGQPAFGAYRRAPDGGWEATMVHVLTLEGGVLARVDFFIEPRLVEVFGLPMRLGDHQPAQTSLGPAARPAPG